MKGILALSFLFNPNQANAIGYESKPHPKPAFKELNQIEKMEGQIKIYRRIISNEEKEIAKLLENDSELKKEIEKYKWKGKSKPLPTQSQSYSSKTASEIIPQNQVKLSKPIEISSLRFKTTDITTHHFPISSEYGWRRDPMGKRKCFHQGLDIATPIGTQVKSPWPGIVVKTSRGIGTGGGRRVHIVHPNGLMTVYMHLKRFFVREGQRIQAGQVIALSGNSGNRTTGPHLHFEIRKNNESINPNEFILGV